jgi:transglutaminase-like putative cysteine protease
MKPAAPLVYGLIACILLVSAPHAEYMPPWISALLAMLLAWRGYLNYSNSALPARWLLLGITVATVAGIQITFHTLFGREAGVALLISLSALKLLELRSMRDATLLIYLSSFIIITNFFNSQNIPTALYMLFTLLLILSTWLQMYSGTLAFKARLRIAATLLLHAIPLTLLLFVLFPRVPGPLWGMPEDSHSSSGLGESMSPGSLSKLSLSQAVAFRVNFDTPAPPRGQMYWRGPVLWDYDGTTWRAGISVRNRLPQLDNIGLPLDYTVTLEPHNKTWLFALDMPTNISIPYVLTDDFQVQSKAPVSTRIRYKAHSQLAYRANVDEVPFQLQRALTLPRGLNPRARALAAEWRSKLPGDDEIIRAAITQFNREGFAYTLEPPPLGVDAVDDFLFDTRKGFCEHYASSFVFLMRAAGIPARVVTGYQGGEPNVLGGYTIVRQSDAHAWAEVWLKQRGWVRIDPTAAIAPERIQSGLSAAMPDNAALPFLARMQAPWLLKIRYNLDMLNHQWNQWVLGYNSERQFAFLTRLGMEEVSWQKMAAYLLTGVTVLLGLIALLLLRKLYPRKTDATQALYLRFCKKISRSGIVRAAHEGPQDFAARASKSLPQQAAAISDITALYLRLRYAGQTDAKDLLALRRAVRAFKI